MRVGATFLNGDADLSDVLEHQVANRRRQSRTKARATQRQQAAELIVWQILDPCGGIGIRR